VSEAYFFGYGSLVNRRTHVYPEARPATLHGWRRVWRPTALQEAAFLSVRRVPGGAIRGLVAAVPGQDWTALDDREAGYDRHSVAGELAHDLGPAAEVHVYAVPDRHHRPDLGGHVWLSYLDTVVQGFLHQYGPEGAAHFFATTDAWPPVIRDDRAAPRYPRAQALSTAERAVVDAALSHLTVRVEPAA